MKSSNIRQMLFHSETEIFYFILNFSKIMSHFNLRFRLYSKELNYSFKTEPYDNSRSSQSLLRIIQTG